MASQRRKNPKQYDEKYKKEIDASSSTNRNLFISFYVFGLYVLISTIGTTDLMLLLPKNSFKMPLIDFELDLIKFYVLAPVLLLVLHFNVLFNHHMHLKKLHAYRNRTDPDTFASSLYDFTFALKNRDFKGKALSRFLEILLYLLPLLLFFYIYVRFADYHDGGITLLHLAVVILDLIFIGCSIVYNREYLYPIKNKFSTFMYYFNRFVIFGIVGFLGVMYFCLAIFPLVYREYDPASYKIYNYKEKHWFPKLVVTEKEMADISPDTLYLPRHLSALQKEKALILTYGPRIDLSNRNLRCADLEKTILTRANIKDSELQGANLKGAQLQAADMTDAKLQGANLREAQLQETILINAQLQGADLVIAQMQSAYLDDSNLTHAHMQNVKLNFAVLNRASLDNVDFRNAELKNATLDESNLTGASMKKANITSASFCKTDLTGADFSCTFFDEGNRTSNTPYFKNAKLQGANICATKTKSDEICEDKKKNTRLDFGDINLTDNNLSKDQPQYNFCVKVSDEIQQFNAIKFEYLKKGIKELLLSKEANTTRMKKLVAQLQYMQCKTYERLKEECEKIGDVEKKEECNDRYDRIKEEYNYKEICSGKMSKG